MLRLDFDPNTDPASLVERALAAIPERLQQFGRDVLGDLPLFGKPTGFVINYAPTKAMRFDLSGRPVEHLEETC